MDRASDPVLPASRWGFLRYYGRLVWVWLACYAILWACANELQLVIPWIQQRLLNNVIRSGVTPSDWKLVLGWVAVSITAQMASTGSGLLMTYINVFLTHRGRQDAHGRIISLPWHVVSRRGASQVTSDMEYVGSAMTVFTDGLWWIVGIGSRLIGAFTALVLLSPGIVLAIVPFALGYMFLPRILSPWLRRTQRQLQDERTKLNAVVLDNIDGMADIKIFGASRWAQGRIGNASSSVSAATWHSHLSNSGSEVVNWALQVGANVAAWAVGLFMVRAGHMEAGTLLAVTLYLNAVFMPLQQVLSLQYYWVGWMVNIDRAVDVFRLDSDGGDLRKSTESGLLPLARDDIALASTVMGYGVDDARVTVDELVIKAGQVTAIVGPNGAGKSTLVLSLLRLLRPMAGRIYVGERDIGSIDEQTWRRAVTGLVGRPAIFGGTVAENMRIADHIADEDKMMRALSAVGLEGWIRGLSEGLRTKIGRGHAPLSTGQLQRLGLARVLLRGETSLIILDEPTSAIERSAIEGIWNVVRGSHGTTIVVATHDDVVVQNADTVISVDHGRVVGIKRNAEDVQAGAQRDEV